MTAHCHANSVQFRLFVDLFLCFSPFDIRSFAHSLARTLVLFKVR